MIDAPFGEFVQALAARTPTPGGGAAASTTGVVGAALLQMVLRFVRGRPDTARREPEIDAAIERLEGCVARMLPMVDRDMAAFERVASAYKLPHGSDDEKVVRTRAIQESLASAMVVPEELLHLSRDALDTIAGVADCANRGIVADLGCAAGLLLAAARAAELIVRVNASYLHDRDLARGMVDRAANLLREAHASHARVDALIEERLA